MEDKHLSFSLGSLSKPVARRVCTRARHAVLEMLERPEFGPGDRIPAERDLALHLGISRMTLRKAIEQLVAEGVLERQGNRGTFVARPAVERPLNREVQDGISKIVEHGGAVPGSRLLYFELMTAGVRLAELLAVAPEAPLVMIKRMRTADGVPFCVETSYLPSALVPGLVAADLIEGASLYQLLVDRYAIQVDADEGSVSVAPMTLDEAQLLDVEPGSPAMVYKGVIFDIAGRPIEYLVSVNHPQRVVFKLNNARNIR